MFHHFLRPFLLGALSIVFLSAMPGAGQAQLIDLDKISKIVRFDTLSDADFEAESFVQEETPADVDLLSYSIRLPKGWAVNPGEIKEEAKPEDEMFNLYNKKKDGVYIPSEYRREFNLKRGELGNVETGPIDDRWLGAVARYFGPAWLGQYSRVEVFVQELEDDISARNWFLRYVLEQGYSLEGMEVSGGERVEGLFVEIKDDISYVVRMLVEINGPYIILVSYHMPVDFWKKEREVQEKVIASFKFKEEKKERISQVDAFSFAGFASFDYPRTWELGDPYMRSRDDMEVQLLNNSASGVLNGSISVKLLGRGVGVSLSDQVKHLRDEMKKEGLSLGERVNTPLSLEPHKTIKLLGIEAYEVKDVRQRTAEYEYWLAILRDKDYYYIVPMLTIGRDSGFYDWALNTETFELVVESIRP